MKRFRKHLSLWHAELGLRTRNRFSEQRLTDDGAGPIVSLTSFGPRLNKVHLVIETLFDQDVPPASVYLWLYEGELDANNLPSPLRRLIERGLNVEFVPDDFKGAKKLIYTVKRFPNRTVVTADDDFLYPHSWLSRLIHESQKTPGHVIVYRAWYLCLERDGKLRRYRSCMDDTHGGDRPSFNILPTGNAGILYPPGSLDERVFDTDLMMQLCPGADDIWFKAMTMLNGVKSRRVNPKNFMPRELNTKGPKLWKTNRDYNDLYLKNVFDHFGLYDLLE